ncbi:hypothetical protein C8R45DRAFT_933905 [Mycena sanguinolenta]|nr:hypothetical protein C8R45DRAFT_933905 [Mycena sanguinolenta]
MANIPSPWPTPDILEKLVQNSSGHFIYAATIIKFIDDKNYWPMQRLAVVQHANIPGSESAFDTLDQLYMTILSSTLRQSQLIPILCAIVHFKLAAGDIDKLFGLAEGETRLLLRSLHSVLDVPSEDEDEDPIASHHASFVDFLRNPDRSGNLCFGSVPPAVLRSAVAELFPLIGSINPDYIFHPSAYRYEADDGALASVASWLKSHLAGIARPQQDHRSTPGMYTPHRPRARCGACELGRDSTADRR